MFLFFIDSSLGRCDLSTLSDQQRMELLFEGFESDHRTLFQDANGIYRDFTALNCFEMDVNGRLIGIRWAYMRFRGSLAIEVLPDSVKHIDIYETKLSGTVNIGSLPSAIEEFLLPLNGFSGGIALSGLPDSLTDIDLRMNSFIGEIDLEHLPLKLRRLDLSTNGFSGLISLTRLPESLRSLHLSGNRLTGSLNLGSLPDNLEKLALCANAFEGTVDLQKLPETLSDLRFNKNQLSGTVNLSCLPSALEYLRMDANRFHGSFAIKNAPRMLSEVYAGNNRFSGTAILEVSDRCFVNICRNSFSKVCMADGDEHMSIWIEYDSDVDSAESRSVTKQTDVHEGAVEGRYWLPMGIVAMAALVSYAISSAFT